MKLNFSAFAFSLLAMTGTALADGPSVYIDPPVAPPAAPAFSWTGFYAGIHGGFGTSDDSFVTANTTLYGAHAGYLHDFGSIVAGAEVSYTIINQTTWPDNLSSARLKGRVGYDGGRFLPYVTGGVGMYMSDISGQGMTFLAGGGLETAIGDNVRLGGEVLWEGNNPFTYSAGPTFNLNDYEAVLRLSYAF